MFRSFTRSPWLMLGTGLAMGLLIGFGMMIGAIVATTQVTDSPLQFPERALHATATDSSNTMAIATGPIDEGTEGLFVLDFITGDLQVSVLNPRTGAIGGLFKHNVVADLAIEQGKQPKFLLVTGQINFRSFGGNVRPAQSVVYVADANTGRFAAYMMPWNRQAAQYDFAQIQPLILLGKGTARNVQIE